MEFSGTGDAPLAACLPLFRGYRWNTGSKLPVAQTGLSLKLNDPQSDAPSIKTSHNGTLAVIPATQGQSLCGAHGAVLVWSSALLDHDLHIYL